MALCPVSNLLYASVAPAAPYANCVGTSSVSWTPAGGAATSYSAYCTPGLATSTTYLVDLWVEMGATAFPCIDEYAHPAPVGVITAGTIYDLLA